MIQNTLQWWIWAAHPACASLWLEIFSISCSVLENLANSFVYAPWMVCTPSTTETTLLSTMTLHFLPYFGNLYISAVADLGGARGARAPPPPRVPKFFRFHAVFGKIWQNCMLAPPLSSRELGAPPGEILDPPLISAILILC